MDSRSRDSREEIAGARNIAGSSRAKHGGNVTRIKIRQRGLSWRANRNRVPAGQIESAAKKPSVKLDEKCF